MATAQYLWWGGTGVKFDMLYTDRQIWKVVLLQTSLAIKKSWWLKCGFIYQRANGCKIGIIIIFTEATDSILMHLKCDCPHKDSFITDSAEKYVQVIGDKSGVSHLETKIK